MVDGTRYSLPGRIFTGASPLESLEFSTAADIARGSRLGKTSIIHSLAEDLGLDAYITSLSRSGLDDNALQELIVELPEKRIALMEDIDAAFHHSISWTPESPENLKNAIAGDKSGPAPPSTDTPKISLSGLLNALDGVGAQEGRLLFATTNRYKTLDAALRRPGRMDVHVEFKLVSQYQAAQLFKRFYMPDVSTPTKIEDVADDGESDKDSGYAPLPRRSWSTLSFRRARRSLFRGGKSPTLWSWCL